jgi:hypothetical protein
MIDRSHPLPVTRQARELGISRGIVYYLPRSVSVANLAVMRRLDELYMDFPLAGSRMLRDLLAAEGVKVGRLHVSTLMKKMAIEAIYRRPNTSKPAPGHKVYPYLLRKLAVTRPNQVWATDITYIPMARGFVHLIAIVDWFSRRVLAWRLSITLETDFCIEALEEALARLKLSRQNRVASSLSKSPVPPPMPPLMLPMTSPLMPPPLQMPPPTPHALPPMTPPMPLRPRMPLPMLSMPTQPLMPPPMPPMPPISTPMLRMPPKRPFSRSPSSQSALGRPSSKAAAPV